MTITGTVGNMPIPVIPNGSGIAQAGAASSLTLNTLASAVADAYKYMQVHILGGTGAGQERNVVSSRKNLLVNSMNMLGGGWILRTTGICSVVSGAADPWGGTKGQIVTIGTIYTNDIYQIAANITTGVAQRFGVWFKRISTSGVIVMLNPSGSGGSIAIDLSKLPDSYIWLTESHAAVTGGIIGTAGNSGGIHIYSQGGATLQFIHAGWQLELATAVGDLIKTGNAQAVGVAVDRPWATLPDATSQYEIYIAGKTPAGVLAQPAQLGGGISQPSFITSTIGPLP